MQDSRRNVFLLVCCQALLLTNAVTLTSIGALAGYSLAVNKAFATLPASGYVIGGFLGTYPASMWMRRVGRRNGFLTGGTFGLLGAILASAAMFSGSLAMLCLGTMLLGVNNAFGQYYRFAAADVAGAANADFKARAISYVLAGGLVGGIVGPEVSKYTRGLVAPTFAASYASLFAFGLVAMAIASRLRIPAAHDSVSEGTARPLRDIVSQPVFVVAVTAGAMGYGVMNLLMTATPLAMGFCGLPYSASATVIASHVIAMFAPSFVTGDLIRRFGVLHVMLVGVIAMFACAAVALSGQLFVHFWWALVLLGVGWNFMYIGGTTLIAGAFGPADKAKAQGVNEVTVFAVLAVSSFSSGVLVNTQGWRTLVFVSLPLLLVALAAILWLRLGFGRPKTASA